MEESQIQGFLCFLTRHSDKANTSQLNNDVNLEKQQIRAEKLGKQKQNYSNKIENSKSK